MTEVDVWEKMNSILGKHAHLTRVENAITFGIPDVDLCYKGKQDWVELKIVKNGAILFRPSQIAWYVRRIKIGKGDTFIFAEHNGTGYLFLASSIFAPGVLVSKSGLPGVDIKNMPVRYFMPDINMKEEWFEMLENIFQYTIEKQ